MLTRTGEPFQDALGAVDPLWVLIGYTMILKALSSFTGSEHYVFHSRGHSSKKLTGGLGISTPPPLSAFGIWKMDCGDQGIWAQVWLCLLPAISLCTCSSVATCRPAPQMWNCAMVLIWALGSPKRCWIWLCPRETQFGGAVIQNRPSEAGQGSKRGNVGVFCFVFLIPGIELTTLSFQDRRLCR